MPLLSSSESVIKLLSFFVCLLFVVYFSPVGVAVEAMEWPLSSGSQFKITRSFCCLVFLSFSLSLLSSLHLSFFLLFFFASYVYDLSSFSLERVRWEREWRRREKERLKKEKEREAASLFLLLSTPPESPLFLPEDVRRIIWNKAVQPPCESRLELTNLVSTL